SDAVKSRARNLQLVRQYEAGFSTPAAEHVAKGILGVVGLGLKQIVGTLVHSPAGAFEAGKGLALDYKKQPYLAVTGPWGLYALEAEPGTHMHRLIKSQIRSEINVWTHPKDNPGFIFMDSLGLITAGAGGVARGAAATRAIRAGEGFGSVSRALISR